jgi:nucleotide-binding universal stress UspA family protein
MAKQRILIPLDGSPFSQHVINHIRDLFPPKDVELILLHVAAAPSGMIPNPPRAVSAAWTSPLYVSAQDAARAHHPIYVTQQEASVGANLELQLAPDAEQLEAAGYAVTVLVQFGDPATTITATAEAEHVDMVAMATHGRTGLRHLLLGSVAEQVLHTVQVPVRLVRPLEYHT